MNRNGPVIIIEDDVDDQEIFLEAFTKLKYENEIIFFFDGEAALSFLNNEDVVPFLILSDINLPKLDGLTIRKNLKTDAKLNIKCIPYLFVTNTTHQEAVMEAYSASAQGFFVKPNSITDFEKMIKLIMDYWMSCVAPKNI